MADKERVAILGGGIAGLTSAFELTRPSSVIGIGNGLPTGMAPRRQVRERT